MPIGFRKCQGLLLYSYVTPCFLALSMLCFLLSQLGCCCEALPMMPGIRALVSLFNPCAQEFYGMDEGIMADTGAMVGICAENVSQSNHCITTILGFSLHFKGFWANSWLEFRAHRFHTRGQKDGTVPSTSGGAQRGEGARIPALDSNLSSGLYVGSPQPFST